MQFTGHVSPVHRLRLSDIQSLISMLQSVNSTMVLTQDVQATHETSVRNTAGCPLNSFVQWHQEVLVAGRAVYPENATLLQLS